jgi:hypothetical protein
MSKPFGSSFIGVFEPNHVDYCQCRPGLVNRALPVEGDLAETNGQHCIGESTPRRLTTASPRRFSPLGIRLHRVRHSVAFQSCRKLVFALSSLRVPVPIGSLDALALFR